MFENCFRQDVRYSLCLLSFAQYDVGDLTSMREAQRAMLTELGANILRSGACELSE